MNSKQHRSLAGCVALGLLVALVSGCTQQSPPPAATGPLPPPFKIVGSTKQIMQAIVIPSSNAVFAAAGEAPKDDAGWAAVEIQAIALAESGNLLLLPSRAADEGDWRKHAAALTAASETALAAIRAKDAEKLTTAGDTVYEVCEACHKQYMPQDAASRPAGDR